VSQDTATDRTGDVVPALRVAGVVAALGVPLGLLWALLAPPVLVRVVADGRVAPLLGESEHRFDALGVFLLFALAIGVLAGTGAWMVRTRRGPAMLLGVLVGNERRSPSITRLRPRAILTSTPAWSPSVS